MDNLNSTITPSPPPPTPLTVSTTAARNNNKPPGLRNLQPRAAARMDFNDSNFDSDDEDNSGILSADYIAQRKTTQDLVDFFKSTPPPPPPPPLSPARNSPSGGGLSQFGSVDDEKKKKPLLQWLRPRKSGTNLSGTASNISGAAGGSTFGGNGLASGRNSMLVQGTTAAVSNISTVSGVTMGKGKNGEDITTSTLPNGRKYIMIAVDYKEGEGPGEPPQRSAGSDVSNGSYMATARLPNGGSISSRRQSRIPDDTMVESALNLGMVSKRMSVMSSTLGSDIGFNSGEKRRSILQTPSSNNGDGSKYVLSGGSFLLENFALDTDFMSSAASSSLTTIGGSGTGGAGGGVSAGGMSSELQRSTSNKSGVDKSSDGGASVSRTNSRYSGSGYNVKLNVLDSNGSEVTETVEPMDEAVVTEALAQRLASYKAQQQQQNKSAATATTTTSTGTVTEGSYDTLTQQQQQVDFPEIILPKPVSRKKVRHVQIQTQHCVMRTMHTQTEPYESLVHDLEIKDWSSIPLSISGSTEVGSTTTNTSTSTSTATTSTSGKNDASTGAVTSAKPNSKVASLAASLTQPTAATTATTTTLVTRSAATSPTTTAPSTPFPNPIDSTPTKQPVSTEASTDNTSQSSSLSPEDLAIREELALLREQNAALQTKVSSLQRDLAAETRARNRTAVAMQDTRDKFEMLSAMAYKKLKEMIFQRHILEMEVRELRAQMDLHSEVNVVKEGEMLYRQEQMMQQQHQQYQYLYQTA
ncbi:hypothetical protein FBU30_006720 [Linnemannia zychae]|nr:hypothetical protein FBU30_006720 [Linnemannia zychae]